jgi:hypothetical protein
VVLRLQHVQLAVLCLVILHKLVVQQFDDAVLLLIVGVAIGFSVNCRSLLEEIYFLE